MRFIRTILSLLLTVLFLVSFAGVRLLVHQCMGCDTTELLFASKTVSCCASVHTETESFDKEEGALLCCAASGSDQCGIGGENECCDFEVIYLKEEFQITQHKETEITNIQVLDVFTNASIDILSMGISKTALSEIPYIDPPPRMVGKAFLLFTHHIKIA